MIVMRSDRILGLALASLLCQLGTFSPRSSLAQPVAADPARVARYFAAVTRGDAVAVQRHLQEGVPLNATNELGLTGLHLAAYQRHEAVVRAILGALPKTSKPVPAGETMTADEYRDSISFDNYLNRSDASALLDAKTPQGMTALHLAIGALDEEEKVYARLVKELLRAGAAANSTDQRGRTPLHKAVELGRAKVVEVLLQNGADPLLRTADGELATDLTRDSATLSIINEAIADQARTRAGQPDRSPAVAGDNAPGNPSRIIVIDADGQAREITTKSDNAFNPAGMDPSWRPPGAGNPPRSLFDDIGPVDVRPSGIPPPYTLSKHQEMLRERLGFPDLFTILMIEDSPETPAPTRLEKWIYLRGGKVFAFRDGDCVSIRSFEPAKSPPPTVIQYNPTQFAAGMTEDDLVHRFAGIQFQKLSLSERGFESAMLRDLDFWSDGAVTLGFARQRLTTVQVACRISPQP